MSKGFYIDSDLFKDNAQYMRTALVAASAVFSDLGDKRKPEYLEAIVMDALERGNKMKRSVIDVIREAGYQATEETIRTIIFWNRSAQQEHDANEVQTYLEIELPFYNYMKGIDGGKQEDHGTAAEHSDFGPQSGGIYTAVRGY